MSDFWNEKRILVTGINGFIGSGLAEKLVEKNSKVIGMVRGKSKTSLINDNIKEKIIFEEANVTNLDSVKKIFSKHEPEICIHLAAASAPIPEGTKEPDFVDINVNGTQNVLDASNNSNVESVILASTTMVYGELSEAVINEGSELLATDSYPVSKIKAEQVAESFVDSLGLNVITLRSSNIYGFNDFNFKRLVPGAINKVLNRESPIVYNKGESLVDLLYFKDALNAYILACENYRKLKGKKFNVCLGQSNKVIDVVNEIIKLSGKDLQPIFVENPGAKVRKTVFDNSLIKDSIDWEPEYSLNQGLEETVNWFKENL